MIPVMELWSVRPQINHIREMLTLQVDYVGRPCAHPQPQEMLQLPDECSYQQKCTHAETGSQHNMRDFIVMNLSAAVTRSHKSHLVD